MPAMYFDTSALVKRYVSEVGSHWVRVTLAQSSQNVVYASALAQPEILSALQRKVRESQLAQVDADRLARRVTSHFATPAPHWEYSPSGGTGAFVLPLRFLYPTRPRNRS
jgi:uncharacterized protein